MKKRGLILFNFLFVILLVGFASSLSCKPTLTIVNQDPYPATPGEEVKIVFQMSNILNTECGQLFISPEDSYPFTLDPSSEREQKVYAGLYDEDYSRYFLGHYTFRVDEDALDGDNKIIVDYGQVNGLSYEEEFVINVDKTKTDFDFSIVSYSEETKELVFDLLNVGENNVDAIVLEVPEQEDVEIYGTNKLVIGDLDSDEDERITLTLDLGKEDLDLKISYTDTADIRREITETLNVDKDSLLREVQTEKSSFFNASFFKGLIAAFVLVFVWRYYKKRKAKKKNHKH